MAKNDKTKKLATALTVYLFVLLAVAAGALVVRLIMAMFGV